MSTPDAYLAEVRDSHRQHVSVNFPAPGICVSRCAEKWPCSSARLVVAVQAVLALTRDTDGNDLPGESEVPVGEFQAAIHEVLDGAT